MSRLAAERVEISGAPAIAGLSFRRMRIPDDYAAMVEVRNAVAEADAEEEVVTVEGMAALYQNLSTCDPARDVVLVEVDGRLIAYARVYWSELNEGGRAYESFGFIRPEWRRRGLATALLRHNEARLREIAAAHRGVDPKWLSSGAIETDAGNQALLERHGYQPVRYSFDMVRETLDDIPAAQLPDGLEVRPVSRDQYRTIWEADSEAFRDHWGEHDESEQAWQRFLADPEYADPALWRVAWDGDQVAGLVINTVSEEENHRFGRRRGYVASVAVRRPWRRRGLARALLVESLRAMRRAGLTSANLGVDAENPTGALRLYESVGFAPRMRWTSYRKPLDAW
jgi:mycothiol synthase